MYAKIALGNVRRSIKDYAVYFVTLLFGVTVFYAFNSLESQSVLLAIEGQTMSTMLIMTDYFMKLFSVVIAVVLAFLVVYANRFIIKRRKREFGTYLMLGMSSAKVARILFYEMILVGLLSLVLGIALGAVLSQALAFATAALIGTTVSEYRFVFSVQGMQITLLCFALLFAITLVMNVVYVSRRKLADLLTTRNDIKLGRKIPLPLRFAGLLAGLVLLVLAFYGLWKNQFMYLDNSFGVLTLQLVAGTFLLFWSGSSVVLAVAQKCSNFYLKGLRAFNLRQVSARLTATFSSMSLVTLLLFFAMAATSVGFGVMKIFVGDIEETTKYDVSLVVYPGGSEDASIDEDAYPALAALKANDYRLADYLLSTPEGETWDKIIDRSAQLDRYYIDDTWEDIARANGLSDVYDAVASTGTRHWAWVIGVGQVNALAKLKGEETIQLAEGEALLDNSTAATEELARALRENGASIKVGDVSLRVVERSLAREFVNGALLEEALAIIVPDSVIDGLKAQGHLPASCTLNVMYPCERVTGDALLFQVCDTSFGSQFPVAMCYTGLEMFQQSGGLKLLCTYLALYIGFVLLVTTAAVLAIQQLSETSDSLRRYRKISVLGCDDKEVQKSLRSQVFTSFLAPLPLALVYTLYAVFVMSHSLFIPFGVDPTEGVLLAMGMVLVVYGCYLAITYAASRSMVKEVLV